MAVATITAIAVTVTAITQAMREVNGLISDIRQTRSNLDRIANQDMQRCWRSTTNVDSQVFQQRMNELDQDINTLLQILNEYEQVLQRSAQEYERSQQQVHQQASNLRSPGNR